MQDLWSVGQFILSTFLFFCHWNYNFHFSNKGANGRLSAWRWVYICSVDGNYSVLTPFTHCSFPQGVRMGETATNVANINIAQGLKIRVEDGCDLTDPCDSNICPENSQCSDDWSMHTCVCDPGGPFPLQLFSYIVLSASPLKVSSYSALHRLFRQGVCGRLPAQSLWARFLLCPEAQFVPRLHLRVWPELLRPVLRKQVRCICLWMDVCCRSSHIFY